MIGDAHLTADYMHRVDALARPGSVAKINLALSALPRFTALPEERGQHGAVIHLVPGAGTDGIARLDAAFAEAAGGTLPRATPLELVLPTVTDPSLRDAEGRHHASLLVPWAPYDLAGTTWAAEEPRWVKDMLAVVDTFAPGTSELVVDAIVMPPKKLEAHFGVTRGHLHHVDDAFVFGDRLPYTTPIGGLYACGAGCAPAGGVFGVAGHNAAKRVLADLELGLERTEVGRK
jgi:phytoene dehydrogenase-like protein